MIRLERKRTASAIKAKYRGEKKKEKDAELLKAWRECLNDPAKKMEFSSAYWKTAKAQLKKESWDKCAYCEANTAVVAHGDLEHYRPKSKYWWLAYTYDNYLYCCQICNQTYKSDNFPIGATEFPAPALNGDEDDTVIDALAGKISPDPLETEQNYTLEDYLERHREEVAHLINPYLEGPAGYFGYEVKEEMEEVEIVPTHQDLAEFVKAAEDFYGINRIELKNFRYQVYTKFNAFKLAYAALDDDDIKSEIKKQLDDMQSDGYLFAGMNRFFNS